MTVKITLDILLHLQVLNIEIFATCIGGVTTLCGSELVDLVDSCQLEHAVQSGLYHFVLEVNQRLQKCDNSLVLFVS